MSDVDDIIEKIKKCMALSRSSNEHEAAAALRQAQKLMEKYSITDAQINESEIVVVRFDCSTAWVKPAAWDCQLMHSVCKAFGGKFLIARGRQHVLAQFTYIGLKINAAVVEYTYAVLARQCIKARAQYLSSASSLVSRSEKIAAGDSFCLAYVVALKSKIHEFAMKPETLALIDAKRNIMSGALSVPIRRGFDSEAAAKGAEAGKQASLLRPMNNAADAVLRLK
jgi:hypothetical protein